MFLESVENSVEVIAPRFVVVVSSIVRDWTHVNSAQNLNMHRRNIYNIDFAWRSLSPLSDYIIYLGAPRAPLQVHPCRWHPSVWVGQAPSSIP